MYLWSQNKQISTIAAADKTADAAIVKQVLINVVR